MPHSVNSWYCRIMWTHANAPNRRTAQMSWIIKHIFEIKLNDTDIIGNTIHKLPRKFEICYAFSNFVFNWNWDKSHVVWLDFTMTFNWFSHRNEIFSWVEDNFWWLWRNLKKYHSYKRSDFDSKGIQQIMDVFVTDHSLHWHQTKKKNTQLYRITR